MTLTGDTVSESVSLLGEGGDDTPPLFAWRHRQIERDHRDDDP
jgi:hypothetical protein